MWQVLSIFCNALLGLICFEIGSRTRGGGDCSTGLMYGFVVSSVGPLKINGESICRLIGLGDELEYGPPASSS